MSMMSLVWAMVMAMVMAILAFGRFVFVTHSGKPFFFNISNWILFAAL
jgi:hypothetical protein